MTHEEATDYIVWATGTSATIRYSAALKQYVLSKIRYCLPYFISLMLNEINKRTERIKNLQLQPNDIDEAFNEVVKNNDHFNDWKSRLFDYFSWPDAEFVHEVLICIAHECY